MLSEFAKSKWTPESVTSGPERDGTCVRTWMISARLREPFWGRRGNEGRNQMSCKSNKRGFKERDEG